MQTVTSRKRRGLFGSRGLLVLAGAGALLLAAAPATAATSADNAVSTGASATNGLAPDQESAALQRAAVKYYAQHYGVPTGVARQRVRIQDDAQAVLNRVVDTLGAQWAGSWFDPDDGGRLKIDVATQRSTATGRSTATAAIAAARKILATKGVDAYADFVPVASSWSDLISAQQTVDGQLSGLASSGKVRTALDPQTNSVTIETANDLTPAQAAIVRAATAPVSIDVEQQDSSDLDARSTACTFRPGGYSSSELNCDPPLRGGVMIGSGNGWGCTATVVVASRSDYKPYVLTAGHCLADGGSTMWSTRFTDGSVHNIGRRHNYVLGSSGDYGIISIQNAPGWDLTANAYVWVGPSAGGTTTQNSFYPLYQVGHSSQNMIVCMSSGPLVPATGYHTSCGTVTHLGTQGNVPGEAETTMCITGGSSGSPVYKNNTGYGIVTAMTKDNSCDSFYQGLTAALQGLNVGLI